MEETSHSDHPFIIRKVFFLYPQTIIRDLYKDIIFHGYDAFFIDDHKIIVNFLKQHKHSILYINIDKVLKDEEWLDFTKKIINHPATKSAEIGVLTDANLNKKYLSRKYLLDLGITCGFISLIPNPGKLLEVILRILEANEAKGRRKHVRVHCTNADTFNFRQNTFLYRGDLVDISSAGILCQLPDKSAKMIPGMVLDSIQLKLQGVLSMASGKVYGTRKTTEDSLQYLIMFDREHMNEKTRANILNYICRRQADFINETSTEDTESAPELGETENGGEHPDNKSNDELTRELIEELQMVDTELGEIDGILKKKSDTVKKADP